MNGKISRRQRLVFIGYLLISSIFVGVMDSIGSLSHLSITRGVITHFLLSAGFFFFPMLAVFSALRLFIERERARKYAQLPPLDLTLPARNPDP